MTARVYHGGDAAPIESQTINVAWAGVGLSGGLYYWSTIARTRAIAPGYTPADQPSLRRGLADRDRHLRYDFSQGEPAPQLVWTDRGAPPRLQGSRAVAGRTASTAATASAATPSPTTASSWRSPSAARRRWTAPTGRSSTSPAGRSRSSTRQRDQPPQRQAAHGGAGDGDRLGPADPTNPNTYKMVNMFRSKLYASTVTISGTSGHRRPAPASVIPAWTEYASDPFWSPDGSVFVFTSFASPSVGVYNTDGLNGDMKKGGAIGIASADMNGVHDDAAFLTTRDPSTTSYYPSVSGDDKLVVFNRSTCGSDPDPARATTAACGEQYGNQSCDGYDDGSAKLWVAHATPGAQPTVLANANGPGDVDNSWPRFSPDSGNFRGDLIYWIAFSSRRAYGMQVNSGVAPAEHQAAALGGGGAHRRKHCRRSELGPGLAAGPEHQPERAQREPRSAVGQGRGRHRVSEGAPDRASPKYNSVRDGNAPLAPRRPGCSARDGGGRRRRRGWGDLHRRQGGSVGAGAGRARAAGGASGAVAPTGARAATGGGRGRPARGGYGSGIAGTRRRERSTAPGRGGAGRRWATAARGGDGHGGSEAARGTGNAGTSGTTCGTPVDTAACADCAAAGGSCMNGALHVRVRDRVQPVHEGHQVPEGDRAARSTVRPSGCPVAIDCRDVDRAARFAAPTTPARARSVRREPVHGHCFGDGSCKGGVTGAGTA